MMTDAPKRRGRPPKTPAGLTPQNGAAFAELMNNMRPASVVATARFRIKAGVIQQAWQHPTGTQWRALPVVAPDAPDWEDA